MSRWKTNNKSSYRAEKFNGFFINWTVFGDEKKSKKLKKAEIRTRGSDLYFEIYKQFSKIVNFQFIFMFSPTFQPKIPTLIRMGLPKIRQCFESCYQKISGYNIDRIRPNYQEYQSLIFRIFDKFFVSSRLMRFSQSSRIETRSESKECHRKSALYFDISYVT